MSKQTHILIAEDEEFVRVPLGMFLERSGYKVSFAVDGEEALEKLKELSPDVVLSDLNMPKVNGFQLLEETVKTRPRLPVIVISGAGTLEAVLRALRSGAWDYLEKPIIDYDLLLHCIESVLEKRKLMQMAERYQQLFEQTKRARTEEREEELRIRKIIEEQLLKSKQEWEETVNFLPDPIVLYTRDHRIIRLNAAMAEALGVDAADAVDMRLCLFDNCQGRTADSCPHNLLMETEEPITSEFFSQKSVKYYEVKVLPFYELWDSRVSVSVLHARDISERIAAQKKETELQTRILQSQKLESVGQLASGIAHEINTPTQYIGSNVDFLEEAFSDISTAITAMLKDPAIKDSDLGKKIYSLLADADWEFLEDEIPAAMQQTREGIRQVTRIVQAMKDFSNPGSKEMQEANLNRIIDTTVTVARNEWKYDAELKLDLDPDLPPVVCLADEIGQVILTMIVNAAHAIAALHNNSEQKEKGCIGIVTTHDEENVVVKITDTGVGIHPDIIDKIFDPFFTTKEVGTGTGQGLAIAFDVVHDKHGGSITVDSSLGEGTTFTIRLPKFRKTL